MATCLERGLGNLKSSLYDTLQQGPSERLSGCRKQLDKALCCAHTHPHITGDRYLHSFTV